MSKNNTPTPAVRSLSDSDYLRFSQLVLERTGLSFPEKRRMDLGIGIYRAFAESICPDLDAYYQALQEQAHDGMEMERLINYLTIGETHFFRDAGQFNALANTVLPNIIERRKSTHTLRIWSAGCASGEEPYSIAMLLHDLLPDIGDWNITILGTDINTRYLEEAHRGIYSDWAFRETRAKAFRPRFFKPQGNRYELNLAIRRMVQFVQLNLFEDCYPSYDTNTMFMDLIICRNVTIYFSEAVTRMIIDRYFDSLAAGGWLAIGHSEHSFDIYKRFTPRAFSEAILYQKADDPAVTKATVQPHAFRQLPVVSARPIIPAAIPHLPAPFSLETSITRPVSSINKETHKPNTPENNIIDTVQPLIDSGQLEQARDLLLGQLAQSPDNAPCCALLGRIYANLGNGIEAERWCKFAIARDPLCLEAYYTLALVLQHAGQRDQAINLMRKVIYIDNDDILGHFSLANLLHDIRQNDQAMRHLKKSRELIEVKPISEFVPRTNDITVGRLAQTIIELQQTWDGAA